VKYGDLVARTLQVWRLNLTGGPYYCQHYFCAIFAHSIMASASLDEMLQLCSDHGVIHRFSRKGGQVLVDVRYEVLAFDGEDDARAFLLGILRYRPDLAHRLNRRRNTPPMA
jgi:hypothetical protein